MWTIFFVTITSLQINRMFPLNDVKDFLKHRDGNLRGRIEYGDFEGYDGMVMQVNMPTHVTISLESSRMHAFIHDKTRVCRCMWDGDVSFDLKKEIVMNMLQWSNDVLNTSLCHRLIDYEDGCVFTQVVQDMYAKQEKMKKELEELKQQFETNATN